MSSVPLYYCKFCSSRSYFSTAGRSAYDIHRSCTARRIRGLRGLPPWRQSGSAKSLTYIVPAVKIAAETVGCGRLHHAVHSVTSIACWVRFIRSSVWHASPNDSLEAPFLSRDVLPDYKRLVGCYNLRTKSARHERLTKLFRAAPGAHRTDRSAAHVRL